jgi:very-short-patch-repair endonuclease
MSQLLIPIIVVVVVIAVVYILKNKTERSNEKRKYQYKRKDFFLSRAEHECYDTLISAVGSDYHVFAQVHLPTLVDHKIVGQNWWGALRHIGEKSVDFVLCDKAYISPRLVIELDDKTHEQPKRQERDKEVECILKEVGLPLLRLENHGRFSSSELSQKIKDVLINGE